VANQDFVVHPGNEVLALYSRGDLSWRQRWSVRRHVQRCTKCGDQVEQFTSATAVLRQEAKEETLTGSEAIANWNALEREMVGNIKVGLDASRCIEKIGRSHSTGWRVAVATGLLSVVFTVGWIMNIPDAQRGHLEDSLRRIAGLYPPAVGGTVVRTTPQGIAVRSQGATLTLLNPSSATVSLSGASAVGARYIDDETGQITITNVYGQ
jgi:hypothetical protein